MVVHLLALAYMISVQMDPLSCMDLDSLLNDTRLHDFPCAHVSANLLSDARMYSAVAGGVLNQDVTFLETYSDDVSKSCMVIMDRHGLLEWFPRSTFNGELIPNQLVNINFAIVSRHNLVFVGTNGDVTEVWHPLNTVIADRKPEVSLVGNLNNGLDLVRILQGEATNLRGQRLKVLYDSFSPYCIVDPGAKELIGGILPEVFEIVAGRLNLTYE